VYNTALSAFIFSIFAYAIVLELLAPYPDDSGLRRSAPSLIMMSVSWVLFAYITMKYPPYNAHRKNMSR
jgi:hypothetical protein